MAKKVSKTGKRMTKRAMKKPTRPKLAKYSKGRYMKSGSKISKGSARKTNRPMLKRDSKGRFMKMSLKTAGPSSRTVTKVRQQTKNKKIERGMKPKNTKKHSAEEM